MIEVKYEKMRFRVMEGCGLKKSYPSHVSFPKCPRLL